MLYKILYVSKQCEVLLIKNNDKFSGGKSKNGDNFLRKK
jgi:hypothetical protein